MPTRFFLRWYASQLDSHPLRTKIITSGLIAGSGDYLCQSVGLAVENNDVHDVVEDDDNRDDRKRHEHDCNPLLVHDYSTTTSSPIRQVDLIRTAKFAFLGAMLVAPATHNWYGYLMKKIPGSSLLSVGKRLTFDQGIFAPIFLTTFVSCLTVLDHVSALIFNRRTTEDETAQSLMQLERQHAAPKTPPPSSSLSSGSPKHGDSSLHSLILTRIQNDVPQSLVVGWSIWIPSMAYMFAFVPGKYQVLFSNMVGFVWNVYLSWKTHR